MSYSPASLLTLQAYLKLKTGLSPISIGIVGNTAHKSGYHLGKDRIYSSTGQGSNDYSVRTTRDKNGLTSAASAMDIGNFPGLRHLSIWLVRECQRNAPGTSDIREIIYSPDGDMVLRYDRNRGVTSAPRLGEADNSHRTHTHISWYRDSQPKDKVKVFKPFFEPVETTLQSFTWGTDLKLGTLVVKRDAIHGYLRLADNTIHTITDPVKFGTRVAFGPVKLLKGIPGGTGDRQTCYIVNTEAAALLVKDVVFTPYPMEDTTQLKQTVASLSDKLASIRAIAG